MALLIAQLSGRARAARLEARAAARCRHVHGRKRFAACPGGRARRRGCFNRHKLSANERGRAHAHAVDRTLSRGRHVEAWISAVLSKDAPELSVVDAASLKISFGMLPRSRRHACRRLCLPSWVRLLLRRVHFDAAAM